jgi:RNA polymerase sigma factor (sigma-70 family)
MNASPVDDELTPLLLAVCQGCKPSFKRLYALTSARLFSQILRINKVRSEAEEVLQETYIAVWRRCTQFNANKGKALNWLLAIAHNLALSSLRQRAARPRADGRPGDDEDDPYAGLCCQQAQPPDRLMQAQASGALRDRLGQLGAEQRQCLALAFYEGLSHQQIAQRLGRPTGTVKSWLRRTLLTLRPALLLHR